MLTASGIPVLSLRISFVTREDGVFVGKGPAVSDGETVHEPELVPVADPLVEEPGALLAIVAVSFAQPASGASVAKPNAAINPFLKKSFLSMTKKLLNE
jgi:hypothetical protein